MLLEATGIRPLVANTPRMLKFIEALTPVNGIVIMPITECFLAVTGLGAVFFYCEDRRRKPRFRGLPAYTVPGRLCRLQPVNLELINFSLPLESNAP